MTERDPDESAGSPDGPAGDPDEPADGDRQASDTETEHGDADAGDRDEGDDGDEQPPARESDPQEPDASSGTDSDQASGDGSADNDETAGHGDSGNDGGSADDDSEDDTLTEWNGWEMPEEGDGPGSVTGETPEPPAAPEADGNEVNTPGVANPDPEDVPDAPGGARPSDAPAPDDVGPMGGVVGETSAAAGGTGTGAAGGGGGDDPGDEGGVLGGGEGGAPDDEEMPLAAHIEEMVRRLAVVVVVMALVSAVVFPFADRLINFLWYSFLPGSVEACRPVAAAAANGTNATVNATGTFVNAPDWTALQATFPNGTTLRGIVPHPTMLNRTYPNGTVIQATFPNGTVRNATLAANATAPGATDAACPRIYQPLALVLARLKMASLAGFVVGLPVFVYQTYLFMRPGLYPNERRYYLSSVPTSLVLAAVGLAFAYFLVLPVIFTYFLGYSQPVANIAFGLAETFDLIILMLGMFALIFQIPLFVMLAIFLGVTSRRWLESRRLYFWAAFAGIAFIFSPDPTGMAPFIVALTMVLLFEGTLLLLRWTGR
jgi:Tat protein translocase TatC